MRWQQFWLQFLRSQSKKRKEQIMKMTFMPQNLEYEAAEGQTILEAATEAGVSIDGNCGGRGTCGKCKVKILRNTPAEAADPNGKLTEEEKAAGIRLACLHQVTEGMVVEIPESMTTAERKRRMIKLPEGFVPQPSVTKHHLKVEATSLKASESDEDRICKALGMEKLEFPVETIRKLPAALEENDEITVTVRDSVVIDVEKGDTEAENYGIAVDIGTTTVVVMLWDLATAEAAGVEAFANPQGAYGADVISRITFAMESAENLKKLNGLIVDSINAAAAKLAREAGVAREHIYSATVVGNTTMSHIFAGVDPSQLSMAPFSPVFEAAIEGSAGKFGIDINPAASVYVGANIAGHVGSDITAGIVTTDIMDCDKGHLFIDIGTNGEIVMSGNGKAAACSTAAGPAFEGSSIRYGMRAAAGAIEKVHIDDEVRIAVIGEVTPVGICGSGIIDAVGELVRTGIVDKTGRLLGPEKLRQKGISEEVISHVTENGGVYDFVLYRGGEGERDILITQKDVREVQLAKAAIAAGISILMKNIGISVETLEKVSIAGAFGNYITTSSAIDTGLLPKVAPEKIQSLGNSAGIGASMILLSQKVRRESEASARSVAHIQLATESDFQDQYMMAMRF
jgi:uncharacterized 2Fe-2S/4Fe-4S cluster protein (DUF4445 family)